MKKLMILVGAIAAFAALALPASAFAEWKMGGEPITEDATIEITGEDVAFTGGTTCETANSMFTLKAGTTEASVDTFEPTGCVPTETLAAVGCEEVTPTIEGLPWKATDEPASSRVKIEGIKITNHYEGGAFCPSTVTISDDTSGGVYLTPTNPNAIHTGTLSGSVSTSLGTQTVSGSGTVDPAGTYGL